MGCLSAFVSCRTPSRTTHSGLLAPLHCKVLLAVFSAQNDLNNARYDYLLNLLRLKQSAGQLSIADLESIEEYLVD